MHKSKDMIIEDLFELKQREIQQDGINGFINFSFLVMMYKELGKKILEYQSGKKDILQKKKEYDNLCYSSLDFMHYVGSYRKMTKGSADIDLGFRGMVLKEVYDTTKVYQRNNYRMCMFYIEVGDYLNQWNQLKNYGEESQELLTKIQNSIIRLRSCILNMSYYL